MLSHRAISIESARLKAESLCARAEYSSAEILNKLAGWGITGPHAISIVDNLVAEGFIDDHRFAMAYVRQQALYSRWGQRKIAMSLRLKGIDSDTIAEALSTITPEEWQQSALDAACAKARSVGSTDYAAKVKIYRHLASRGFDSTTINAALRHINHEDDLLD